MIEWVTDELMRRSGMAFPGAARPVTPAAMAATLRPGEDLTRTTTAGPGEQVALVVRPGGRQVTVFLYGNAMTMLDTLPVRDVLSSDGAGVVCVDYVGYGLSPGTPSEGGCYRAAHAALTRAEAVAGDGNVDVVGFSLGSAVALELAAARTVRRLVLLGPMSGVAGYALAAFRLHGSPLRRLGPFAGADRAAAVSCPILLVGGSADRLTPPWMAQGLAEAATRGGSAPTVELVTVEGAAHNDLFSYPEVWRRTLGFLR